MKINKIYIKKINLRLPKGKSGGGINWELGISRHTLLYIKEVTNKDLLLSTGNYIQYPIKTYNGKDSKKIYMYIDS